MSFSPNTLHIKSTLQKTSNFLFSRKQKGVVRLTEKLRYLISIVKYMHYYSCSKVSVLKRIIILQLNFKLRYMNSDLKMH